MVDENIVPIAEHLVATTRDRVRTLTRPDHARWLWTQLRLTLGAVLSFVIMPDHLHLVARAGLVVSFTKVLAAFTARTGVRFDVRVPERANTEASAARMMRYGFFNPVRDKLVDDPWRWPWSTLRDLGGAAYPCWTALDEVAATLGMRADPLMRGLTTVANRQAPPRPQHIDIASLAAVRSAVGSVLRSPPRETAARSIGRSRGIRRSDPARTPALRTQRLPRVSPARSRRRRCACRRPDPRG